MTLEVTVGIDIGTTSVKALAVDGDGRVVAHSRVPHDLLASRAGELAHPAAKAWRDGVLDALARVRYGHDARRRRARHPGHRRGRHGAVAVRRRRHGPTDLARAALRRRARRGSRGPGGGVVGRAGPVPGLARAPPPRGGRLLAGPGGGQRRPQRGRGHRHRGGLHRHAPVRHAGVGRLGGRRRGPRRHRPAAGDRVGRRPGGYASTPPGAPCSVAAPSTRWASSWWPGRARMATSS